MCADDDHADFFNAIHSRFHGAIKHVKYVRQNSARFITPILRMVDETRKNNAKRAR